MKNDIIKVVSIRYRENELKVKKNSYNKQQ